MVSLIVIGASAGGLKPLEEFFSSYDGGDDTCFLIVQHLSPNHRSMMKELLGRKTELSISTVADGAPIVVGMIYLNSPHTFIEVEGNTFAVRPYSEEDAHLSFPISTAFKSAARSKLKTIAGVVLSGTGSDGAEGAVDLFDANRGVFVEDPKSAAFAAMPEATIRTTSATAVADARKLAKMVKEYIEQSNEQRSAELSMEPHAEILQFLEETYGLDFSQYKKRTILRRVARQQEMQGFDKVEDFVTLLRDNEEARYALYSDLLIGVTEFFRDPDAFLALRELVIPHLVERARRTGEELRIWVPGCATGQEAYSIAIELSEALRKENLPPAFRVIATDVFNPSVRIAGLGIYTEKQMRDVPQHIKERYFTAEGDHYSVISPLRQRIVFSTHNTISDPPFMNLDLITCRNMLIYLDDVAQRQVLSRFVFGLKQNGFLMLGPSESLARHSDDFVEINAKWRLFRKHTSRRVVGPTLFQPHKNLMSTINQHLLSDNTDVRPSRPPLDLATSHLEEQGLNAKQTLGGLADLRKKLITGYDALLKRYAPSSILVTTTGEVLTWFGSASIYIDTQSNLAEWRVEELIHQDLQYPINIGIETLRSGNHSSFKRDVVVRLDDGLKRNISVTVEPLSTSKGDRRILLVLLKNTGDTEKQDEDGADITIISDDDERRILNRRIQELESDLRLTEESLQYVTERLEANTEQLQASNEELQASNEELQASNEELQASNEELQAVNEELLSVSAEHEAQFEFISEVRQDHESVLRLLTAAVLILDEELRIIRFTEVVGHILGLEQHDLGRSIENVGARPDFANIGEMVGQALSSHEIIEATGQFKNADLTIKVYAQEFLKPKKSTRIFVIFTGDLVSSKSVSVPRSSWSDG